MNVLRLGTAVVGLLLAVPPGALPAFGAPSTGGSEHTDVALVSERASVRPGDPFRVGLHMRMKGGWHTYWKQPGDAGLPLRVEWTLPAGFTAGPIEWPAPDRIPAGELMSYGYGDDVLLAVTITPPVRIEAASVTIGGAFDWLECKEACLAASARLEITLPVRPEPAKPGVAARLFADARARSPRSADGWALAAVAGPRAIEVSFRPPQGVTPRGAYLFVDQPLVVEHAAAQGFERTGDRYRVTAVPAANATEAPRRITGVLVVDGIPREQGGALAVDVEATAGDPSPAPVPARSPWPTVLYGIAVALTGLALVLRLRRGNAGA